MGNICSANDAGDIIDTSNLPINMEPPLLSELPNDEESQLFSTNTNQQNDSYRALEEEAKGKGRPSIKTSKQLLQIQQIDSLKNLYTLHHELGRGRQSRVVFAQDKQIKGQKNAIKIIRKEDLSSNSDSEAELMEKIKVQMRTQHKNVVKIVKVLESPRDYYIVMEYVTGGSLRERLLKGPLPIAETVQIIGQITNLKEVAQQRGKRLVATFQDETGSMELVWFRGHKWIREGLKLNKPYMIFGRTNWFNGKFNMPHPDIELKEEHEQNLRSGMQAIYPSTDKLSNRGISNRIITKMMQQLFLETKGKFQA